jgi:hypothetical protein
VVETNVSKDVFFRPCFGDGSPPAASSDVPISRDSFSPPGFVPNSEDGSPPAASSAVPTTSGDGSPPKASSAVRTSGDCSPPAASSDYEKQSDTKQPPDGLLVSPPAVAPGWHLDVQGHPNAKSFYLCSESISSDNEVEVSKSTLASNEFSDSDEITEVGDNTLKANNGLILAPQCSQQCFMGHIKCHHKKQQVTINTPGDYLGFDATWWHQGYFIHATECTYYTVQLFCVPSHQMQSSTRVQRRTTRLDNYIVGHIDESVVSGLTSDLVSKWDDNDDHGYSADKYPPSKKFQQQPIDNSKNRHIRYEQIAKLPRLQRVTTEIEQKLGNITVDSVWLIKKQRRMMDFNIGTRT